MLTTGVRVDETPRERGFEDVEMTEEATTDEARRDDTDDVDKVILLLPINCRDGLSEVDATRVWPPVTVEERGRLLVDAEEELPDRVVKEADFNSCDGEEIVFEAVDSFVLCTPVTEIVLLALPVGDAKDLAIIDFADEELVVITDWVLFPVVRLTDKRLEICEDEVEELLLLLWMVGLEELDEAKIDVYDGEEGDAVTGEAAVINEVPLSGEFQGP